VGAARCFAKKWWRERRDTFWFSRLFQTGPALGVFPLPVEVVPFTLPWVMDEVAKIGGNPVLRMKLHSGSAEEIYLTDQQNYI